MRPPWHRIEDLRRALAEAGARPVHLRPRLRAWLGGEGIDAPARAHEDRLPRHLVQRLPGIAAELDALLHELAAAHASDGSCRRLYRLRSGHSIETVDLPGEGLCVSTQVGCAVGCRFCKTGESGLLHQLDPLEILAQVATARRTRRVRRVVFMGMGEPAHNLEAVLEAIEVLGIDGDIPHKALVFSTVGEPAVFERLVRSKVRPALALSLHSLDPDRRAHWLPRAPRVDPAELVVRALEYAEHTGYPLQIQWTLIEGFNDSIAEARALASRLAGRRAIVNYIPLNAVETRTGEAPARPPIERCVELVRTVRRQGGLATLRQSAGQEVEAGCGQLRASRAVQTRTI